LSLEYFADLEGVISRYMKRPTIVSTITRGPYFTASFCTTRKPHVSKRFISMKINHHVSALSALILSTPFHGTLFISMFVQFVAGNCIKTMCKNMRETQGPSIKTTMNSP
jgi:hypothetical protein